MSDSRSSYSNLDQYLQAVQKREKSKFRHKFILLIVAILGLTGMVVISKFFPSTLKADSHKVVKASFNDLDAASVSSIFSNDLETQLVIEYPFGLEDDTVSSLDEYLKLVASEQVELSVSENPVEDSPTGVNILAEPLFFIEGNPEVRAPLTLAIANYDPNFTYEMDFGNGITREITEQISDYSYRSTGTFTLNLAVKDDQGNRRSHERTLIISPKLKNSLPSDEVGTRNLANEELPAELAVPAGREPDISRLRAATTEDIRLEEIPVQNVNTPTDLGEGSALQENSVVNAPTLNRDQTQPEVSETSNVAAREATPPQTSPEGSTDSETKNASVNINLGTSQLPLYSASKMPRFKGGKSAMARYFRSNLTYPQEALSSGTEGVVKVQFVVEPDGSISNPKIINGIGSGCDEEAIRLMLKMPSWIPGEEAGSRVAVLNQLAIKFDLRYQ
ncbi:MAG: TonB family protein [Bacteroidota bacterium]